jgi:predicted nucleic acid-binding Zn ribbon protein
MPTYKYKCNGCNKDYIEHREVTHPQTFTHCDQCETEYTEVTE